MLSSELWHRVVWYVSTNVSEEHTTAFFGVEASKLKMQAERSHETSLTLYQATRCHNPEDHSMNFLRREYLKYVIYSC
jgi:hypothetical protein